MLTLSIKATDLGIPPQVTIIVTWNKSESLEDGSSGMKHLKRCSYTIDENEWSKNLPMSGENKAHMRHEKIALE